MREDLSDTFQECHSKHTTCAVMQESIQSFFRYQSTDEAMLPCAEPHVNMNYMHAPDYELQMRFLERYVADAAPSDRLLTLVLSVGYWVWTPDVPQVPTFLYVLGLQHECLPFMLLRRSCACAQAYLDFLESIATKVHRIVIISIATVHTMAHAGKQVFVLLVDRSLLLPFIRILPIIRSSAAAHGLSCRVPLCLKLIRHGMNL